MRDINGNNEQWGKIIQREGNVAQNLNQNNIDEYFREILPRNERVDLKNLRIIYLNVNGLDA